MADMRLVVTGAAGRMGRMLIKTIHETSGVVLSGALEREGSNALAELTVAKLGPIRAEVLRLKDDPGFVDGVLAEGAEKARAIARPNMDAVKDVLGLIR